MIATKLELLSVLAATAAGAASPKSLVGPSAGDFFFSYAATKGDDPVLSIYNPTNFPVNFGNIKIHLTEEGKPTLSVPLYKAGSDDSYAPEVGFDYKIQPKAHVRICSKETYESGAISSPEITNFLSKLGDGSKIELEVYGDIKDSLTRGAVKKDNAIVRDSAVCKGTGSATTDYSEWNEVSVELDSDNDYKLPSDQMKNFCSAFPSLPPQLVQDKAFVEERVDKIRVLKDEWFALNRKIWAVKEEVWAVTDKGAGVFISEVSEGSRLNKYVELYNPTNEKVRIVDLKLFRVANGKGFPDLTDREVIKTGLLRYNDQDLQEHNRDDFEFKLGKYMIDPFSTYTICHSGFDSSFADMTESIEEDFCDFYSDDIASFNGNDALVLTQDLEVIDVFGNPDNGEAFKVCGNAGGAKDVVLRRNPTVCSGNAKINGSFGTSTQDCEWISYDSEEYMHDIVSYSTEGTGIGAHQVVCGSGQYDDERIFTGADGRKNGSFYGEGKR